MKAAEVKTTVYFDGLCPLCSREIEHYQNSAGSAAIRFVDITHSGFDARVEGVDPKKVHQHLHVKDSQGRIRTGVDGFIEIWRQLPRYQWLATAANPAPVKAALRIGYSIFAKIRPLLPRRTRSCEASPFCDSRGKI